MVFSAPHLDTCLDRRSLRQRPHQGRMHLFGMVINGFAAVVGGLAVNARASA